MLFIHQLNSSIYFLYFIQRNNYERFAKPELKIQDLCSLQSTIDNEIDFLQSTVGSFSKIKGIIIYFLNAIC